MASFAMSTGFISLRLKWLWRRVDRPPTSSAVVGVKTHIQRSGAGRRGAERPAACDLIRANKSTALFPRIISQAACRSAVCVFLPL